MWEIKTKNKTIAARPEECYVSISPNLVVLLVLLIVGGILR